jgi:hypothetical protein
VSCGPELTKSELVMVFIVQDVYEGGQERVKILVCTTQDQRGESAGSPWTHIEQRKLIQDCTEFLVEAVLSELDFAHVKLSYATYLKVFVDNLSMAEDSA